MKSNIENTTAAGSLTPDHWDVPIRVRLVPYVAFSRRLDEKLEKLVQQWLPKAAPCAKSPRR
jgi:hypothetical protein